MSSAYVIILILGGGEGISETYMWLIRLRLVVRLF